MPSFALENRKVFESAFVIEMARNSAIAEILLWFTPEDIFRTRGEASAIAEIILWFTPRHQHHRAETQSAIAEILIWFTPAYRWAKQQAKSAIAEILIWFTPFVCKGNDFQSFMQVLG